MEMVDIRIPEWREETGECLNCGKETPFYDRGYFCTYECRKEYEKFIMSEIKMWFVGYDREDKSRKLLLSSEDFNLVHNYYIKNKRKYRVENNIKLYIWSE